jgi:hypothetical protein
MEITKEEHLQWCKDRAMKYLDKGDYKNAVKSFISDMNKHIGTANHPALNYLIFSCNSVLQTKEFIEGFN